MAITAGTIGFVVLFILLALGLPIGFGLGIIGFTGLWWLVGLPAALSKLASGPWDIIASYDLSTLPLFMLMAEVCFAAGLTKDLYNLAARWMGHLPGGIAIATVAGCAGFAAITSSSIACTATMGLVALPEMRKYNYKPSLATACIAAGGTLGILIPPSGVFILYGILTENSIGDLFVAGIIPGIILATLYILVIYIQCRIKPEMGPAGPAFGIKEKFAAFGSCGESIALILLVLGGLIVGWFTPTEAGAIGAFGAIVFSLIRHRLSWQGFKTSLVNTARTAGMIYLILIGASLFSPFIALSTIPMSLANWIASLSIEPVYIMLTIIILYIVLGTFMEESSMFVVTLPIFYPLVLSLGYDPIWFGVMAILMVMIGMITPPVGITMFVIGGIAKDVPMTTIFRGVIPFVAAAVVCAILLLVFPQLALFLPGLTK